jgi:hypothetical protein
VSCGACADAADRCYKNHCCTPRTCSDVGRCGTGLADGCGGTLDCACSGGQVCLSNGTCCLPRACTCGYSGDDGCGNTITCPDCPPK